MVYIICALQCVRPVRGGGDDREGRAGTAACVRARGAAQRGDDPCGAGREADGQVPDQRQAPLGQDLRPQLQALRRLMPNTYYTAEAKPAGVRAEPELPNVTYTKPKPG